jgi:hypothetical protein
MLSNLTLPQESGLEVLRKNGHDEAHALEAFHDF